MATLMLKSSMSKYARVFVAICIAGSASNVSPVFAQGIGQLGKTKPPERYGLEGGQFSLRGRHDGSDVDTPVATWLEVQVEANGYVNLTKDGCLKLHARVNTGDKYVSNYSNTGVGDKSQNLELNMRLLYIDYTCYLKKVALQAGAMPVLSQGMSGANLNGWADGFRLIYKLKATGPEVSVTAGQVNQTDTPSVFERDFKGFNYLQVYVNQDITKNLKAYVDLTRLDANTYLNMTMTMIVSDYIKYVDQITADIGLVEGNYQSSVLMLTKNHGKWKIDVGYMNKRDFQGHSDQGVLPTDNFYAPGNNGFVSVSRNITKRFSVSLRVHKGSAPVRVDVTGSYKF